MSSRKTSLNGLAAALLVPCALLAQAPPQESQTVVFVCEHGAAKSVIAAAHFNKLAKERGLPFTAVSRGTQPDPAVSTKVIEGLRAEGLPVTPHSPQLLSDKDLSSAARVVALGCKLPERVKPMNWNDLPSVSESYRDASIAIRQHVEKLMDELASAKREKTQ